MTAYKRNFAKPPAIKQARELRISSTEVEKKLWYRLRNRQMGVKFRRQHPLQGYILDFVCEELKLGIELDGGQHNEMPQQKKDAERTEILARSGWQILRFWNNDVIENIDGVLLAIQEAIATHETLTRKT